MPPNFILAYFNEEVKLSLYAKFCCSKLSRSCSMLSIMLMKVYGVGGSDLFSVAKKTMLHQSGFWLGIDFDNLIGQKLLLIDWKLTINGVLYDKSFFPIMLDIRNVKIIFQFLRWWKMQCDWTWYKESGFSDGKAKNACTQLFTKMICILNIYRSVCTTIGNIIFVHNFISTLEWVGRKGNLLNNILVLF